MRISFQRAMSLFSLILLMSEISIASSEVEPNPPSPPQYETPLEIAFVSDRDGWCICVMDRYGGNVRAIDTFLGGMPSWSPDGSKIAISSKRGAKTDIYVTVIDSRETVRLTDNDLGAYFPKYSPDGLHMVFTSTKLHQGNIYTVNLLTMTFQNLTNQPGLYSAAAWSPDGSQIVFSSLQNDTYDIFIMDSDGSNLHKLVDTGYEDEYPAWSPDGSQIAFGSAVNRGVDDYDIYLINPDGTNPRKLTHGSNPSWSPDGTEIVYHEFVSHTTLPDIFVINVKDGRVRQLTTHPGYDYLPVWRPQVTR